MNENEDQPIRALADLESPVSETFLQYFRRKIYRRTATAQLTNFSLRMPLAILMELLAVILHVFRVADGKKGRSS
jgi:hypothetical protein